jgi:hypothetical protein
MTPENATGAPSSLVVIAAGRRPPVLAVHQDQRADRDEVTACVTGR